MIEGLWLWLGDFKDRLKLVILGLLFWLVFTPGAVLVCICQFCGIFKYLFTGSVREQVWVTSTGQGTDGLNNAGWFGGDPRETISSHTGRWILSGKPLPLKFRFVRWLTNKFEQDHCVKAIQEPFRNQPLQGQSWQPKSTR